jgi:hypothetical protein
MIPNTELQIGNVVLFKGEVYTIQSGSDIDNCADYEPIKLTKEILMNELGFDYHYGFIKHGLTFKFVDESIYLIRFNKADSIKIKYLHQLQNFWYWQVGNMLKIEKSSAVSFEKKN